MQYSAGIVRYSIDTQGLLKKKSLKSDILLEDGEVMGQQSSSEAVSSGALLYVKREFIK